jgi:hypothetical protein
MRKVIGNGRMTEAEIRSIVDKLGNIAEVLSDADRSTRQRSSGDWDSGSRTTQADNW